MYPGSLLHAVLSVLTSRPLAMRTCSLALAYGSPNSCCAQVHNDMPYLVSSQTVSPLTLELQMAHPACRTCRYMCTLLVAAGSPHNTSVGSPKSHISFAARMSMPFRHCFRPSMTHCTAGSEQC